MTSNLEDDRPQRHDRQVTPRRNAI